MTTTATPAGSSATEGVRPAAHTDPTLRRVRGVVGWVVLLVLGGIVLALVAGSPAPQDYLHPDGTGQRGTGALVEVLRDRGIDVDVAETAGEVLDAGGDRPGSTVVVGNTEMLTTAAARRMLERTRDADRVVFLDGAPDVLGDLGLGLGITYAPVDADIPRCSLPWVRPDDRVSRVTWSIVADGPSLPQGATGCYPLEVPDDVPQSERPPSGYAVVDLPAGSTHAPVTVVGFPDAATNRFVVESEHAGLVVRLLGASPHLVWYHPTAADVTENPPTGEEAEAVWPAWTTTAAVVVSLAFVVFAVARGRRLGRLVPEPLPVVVRATETTEDRARMYRSAADRSRAAAVLRRATATRLATRLGLTRGAPTDDVARAAAAATGLDAAAVDLLLRGAAPADEAALVTLAQQLTSLEEKVSTP
ncbi:DUF4350 domain-containing protein [Phycicoccus sp. CSK15P-2]|uniref:DUF4350 domain-containing protein n=1 Tax=Phycicoccus sp. CSK15P-2 TaxID=2807627 RepID=UPI001951EB48|nr:DUF4350 domain-containing protein [Phycicoccus sp. CSK15P-2]MBM6402897.1 DUF4350 domain-containing protein [Phycicoccus sp. CSK15P-2]